LEDVEVGSERNHWRIVYLDSDVEAALAAIVAVVRATNRDSE
jgi:hypothetical protein